MLVVRVKKTVRLENVAGFCKFVGSLEYDRSYGKFSKGRLLVRNSHDFGVRPRIRLEPSEYMNNIGDIDYYLDSAKFPCGGVIVSLWDVHQEQGVHHRCPLFDEGTGLSSESISFDELHILYAGVFQTYVGVALWRVILCDALQTGSGQNN